MDDMKFSVVIPLYNKELSIVNTILSVLKQSYQNFELLVVNDGSTDGSVDTVKTINDERIRLINQENQGVSAARNRGIKEASFEWIAFLDGDDMWESNHLEEIVKMMKVFPENKVYVTSFEFSDKRKMFKHERSEPIFKIDNYFKEAIKENLLWTSVVVINKLCFKKIGGFNTTLTRGEDLEFWSRIAKSFDIVKSLKITAMYRIDAENRTSLTNNIEKTHVYYLPIRIAKNNYEKKYYKYILFTRLKSYLRRAEIKTFFKLIIRYQFIVQVEFLIYLIKKIFCLKVLRRF